MTTRRRFMQTLILGGAATGAFSLLACNGTKRKKLTKFGFISGILKDELDEDWKLALKQAVDMGFSEYEGKYKGSSPEEFLGYCGEIGLKPVASGINMSKDMDQVRQQLENIKKLDVKYAVIYWPWFTGGPFDLAQCKESAQILDQIGTIAREYNLMLCWHNHDQEFHAMEEGLPFDYLMQHTDPGLVRVEMDIYWVKKGGGNPLSVLQQYKGRIPILHVKDMQDDAEQSFACPGSGIIDFPSIFAEALDQGIEHFMVERDNVPDGMACLKSSSAYLKSLRF